jgi:DnaA family protein
VTTLVNRQLPLGLSLPDSATFANFLPGPNVQAVAAVEQCATGTGERFVYLWGGSGTGKTHLLQAACQRAGANGDPSAYVPLSRWSELSVAVLEGLHDLALVCLDDIQTVAGRHNWEEGLFHFFNRWRDGGGRLVVAATSRAPDLDLLLPDLKSRLSWGLTYSLRFLDDEQKIHALQLRARARGFDLADDVGRYLLRHFPRDMTALFSILDHLDDASLIAQRRLTIPFIKSVLAN